MCLGDSITIGARSMLAYPEYCGDYLSKETNKKWNVINHATSGFRTIDLVRSITNDFTNLKNSRPDLVTILIGTNDLKSNTSVADFRIAYSQVVLKARLILGNSNIVLIKIPKFLEGVMLPYKISMNEKVNGYNNAIEEIGNQDGLMIAEMEISEDDFFDGVHLNDRGSENWGKQLCSMVVKMRRSEK